MKLYVVHCKGDVTNNMISIVTIHKTRQGAEDAMENYRDNWHSNINSSPEYSIAVIDTEIDGDLVYDFEDYD